MEGKKHDQDKIRMELLPWPALEEIAKVLTFGAKKYDDWNWAKGMSWSRLLGAILRHFCAWARGDSIDKETGLSHLAHIGCCVLFLLTYEKEQLGVDDRHIFNKELNYATKKGEIKQNCECEHKNTQERGQEPKTSSCNSVNKSWQITQK